MLLEPWKVEPYRSYIHGGLRNSTGRCVVIEVLPRGRLGKRTSLVRSKLATQSTSNNSYRNHNYQKGNVFSQSLKSNKQRKYLNGRLVRVRGSRLQQALLPDSRRLFEHLGFSVLYFDFKYVITITQLQQGHHYSNSYVSQYSPFSEFFMSLFDSGIVSCLSCGHEVQR